MMHASISRAGSNGTFGPRHAGGYIGIALALLLLLAPTASAERYGDLEITAATPAGSGSTGHGYAAYAVRVSNRSATRAHTVTITIPRSSYGSGSHIRRLSRTARVGPESTVRIDLYQPPLSMNGSNIGVSIDGRWQERPLSGLSYNHMQFMGGYRSGGAGFNVMLSRSINRSDVVNSYQAAYASGSGSSSSYGPSSGSADQAFIQPDQPVAAWPDNWLAYSRYDGVMLTAEEMRRLPPAVRSAITGYVEAGGTLVVLGEWDPPASWSRRTEGNDGSSPHFLGFGIVRTIPDAAVEDWDQDRWRPLKSSFEHTARPWDHVRSVGEAHEAMPVVEDLGVPVRGMFALMLVFAVLIGPVNLLALKRWNRRIWLLWTVPAVSLLFCGAVFAYNIVAEGFTAYSRTQLITVLDQTRQRAASIGWTAYYAPLTPGDGLHFEADTELTPQVAARSWNDAGRARTVDWTRDQHLASGWITARVPAHFMVRRAGPSRKRIEFGRVEDGTITALNGLGVDIRELRYAGADGRLYRASNIPAGQKATLEPTGGTLTEGSRQSPGPGEIPAPADHQLHELYAKDWVNHLDDDAPTPRRGTYTAVTESAAFLDPGLPNTAVRPAPSIVYGITEK